MSFDAIIVGAGPAGAAAAYDLAAQGRRVLLIDKRRFPRQKPCAGGLTIKTLRAIRFSVAPVIRRVCRDLIVARGLHPARRLGGAHAICAMTVRSELDDFALQQTVARGARFEITRGITSVTEDHDGVTVHMMEGEVRARFVVAADGANSHVRRLVSGQKPARSGFAIEGIVPFDPAAHMEFDFGVVDGGYGWLFPKHDHINVGLYTWKAGVRVTREMLEDYVARRLGPVPISGVVGHAIGCNGGAQTLGSERLVYAGDAAGLADPLLGEGIHNAVVSGQAAASAIERALRAGGSVRAYYEFAVTRVLRDVRIGGALATRFYSNLAWGYRVLTSPLIWPILIRGSARGLTLSRMGRLNYATLLLPVHPPASLLSTSANFADA